ncbi:MAG: Spy/CpxP family protein refolding chaperone [candidate division NC10 bacterium]|nr:Spy/CpxP family protein refolding chaperone [candidate division NC10 bacterium]
MNALRGGSLTLIALFVLGTNALGGLALAQMGPGMMGPGKMGPGGQMRPGMMGPGGLTGAGSTNDRPWITVMLDHREELGLSAEQVGQLFALRDGFAKQARIKSEALEKVERDLDQLIGPGSVDLRAVEAKLKEAEAMRTDLRLARLKVIEEGKGVLTPDQRKKLVEMAKAEQPSSLGPAPEGPRMGSPRGMEEMERFMQSDRAPQAMAAMMEMARRMGNGDLMLGMVR